MKGIVYILAALAVLACSSSALKYEKAAELRKNQEFESAVKIERPVDPEDESDTGSQGDSPAIIPPSSTMRVAPSATPSPEELKLSESLRKSKPEKIVKKESAPVKAGNVPRLTSKPSSKKTKKSKVSEAPTEVAGPSRREPDLEDDTGFQGRRPIVDPFRVGEEVVHSMHYFKVSAGELKMKVGKMATVNGRKAYNFGISLKTSPVFSSFYSVDDYAETFVDYETLVPRVFQLHVKETAQLREARMIFDEHTNKARFWEKKVNKEKVEEEKKQEWDILPFSQNVYSAVFYMRNFKWEVGNEYAFRVADDEQNLIFKGKALRKEKLETELGVFDTVVVKPEVMLKGVFKPVGDIYIWLSDDDRHYILRIESKIKIGTIISEVISIKPGQN